MYHPKKKSRRKVLTPHAIILNTLKDTTFDPNDKY